MRFLHEYMRKIGMVWYIIWYIKFNMYTLCFCKCHIWQNYCSHPQAVIKFSPNQSNYSFRLKQGSSKLIHSWFKFFCIHIEVWKKLKQYIFGSIRYFPDISNFVGNLLEKVISDHLLSIWSAYLIHFTVSRNTFIQNIWFMDLRKFSIFFWKKHSNFIHLFCNIFAFGLWMWVYLA